MARDCPFCSTDPDRPAVEMKSLRSLVLHVWGMELAQKDLLSPDDLYTIASHYDPDIPLSGLQTKLADISIGVGRILRFVWQILEADDWQTDPFYLMRHSQLLTPGLDKKL